MSGFLFRNSDFIFRISEFSFQFSDFRFQNWVLDLVSAADGIGLGVGSWGDGWPGSWRDRHGPPTVAAFQGEAREFSRDLHFFFRY